MAAFYCPEPIWSGQDAYVIGGGPSLKGFDWSSLKGRNTVGCNSAYMLGLDVCRVCFFGDRSFFMTYHKELESCAEQGMPMVTNCPSLVSEAPSWLKVMKRQTLGLATGDRLGWNWSSGAASVNLALSFGARRVFLLGIDLAPAGRDHNWHDRRPRILHPSVYHRFMIGFRQVALDAPRVFPGCELILLSDNPSTTIPIPVRSRTEHFLKAGDEVDVNSVQESTTG